MTPEITTLESPIDVMYLLHKALRTEAARVEQIISQLGVGGSLLSFKRAFSRWAKLLGYHAVVEDRYLTAPLAGLQPARDNEAAHQGLAEQLESLQADLDAEVGLTLPLARTQRHLYGKVVTLRIAQDDHFEEEEAFVLPLIRQRIREEEQLEMARRLLIDEEAADRRWVFDWLAGELTPTERQLLADLVARFKEVPTGSG